MMGVEDLQRERRRQRLFGEHYRGLVRHFNRTAEKIAEGRDLGVCEIVNSNRKPRDVARAREEVVAYMKATTGVRDEVDPPFTLVVPGFELPSPYQPIGLPDLGILMDLHHTAILGAWNRYRRREAKAKVDSRPD